MPIINRASFNDVDFFPLTRQKVVGTIGIDNLIGLGREQGSNALVVARCPNGQKWQRTDLHAIVINELLNHTQEPIELY